MTVDEHPLDSSQVYQRLAGELSASNLFNGLIDDVKVKFIYSTRLFSRLKGTLRREKATDDVGKTNFVNRTEHSIYVDMPSLWFFTKFATDLFYPQRTFAEYFEGAVTGTIFAIDEMPTKRKITAHVDYLNENFSDYMTEIRRLPDQFWGKSLANMISPLRRHFFSNLSIDNHKQVDRLVFNIIARFILGHEAGHYIYNNVPTRRDWVLEAAQVAVPEHTVNEDVELFADIIGLEYCLRLEGIARRDPRPSLTVLLIVFALFDALGLDLEKTSTRGLMTSALRTQLLLGHLEASTALSQSEKMDLHYAIVNSAAAASAFSVRLVTHLGPALKIFEAKTMTRMKGVGREIAAVGVTPRMGR